MSRLIDRVKFGSHGQGSLAKYDDGPNWISIYCTRGREHRESTGTPDLKLARRFHKQRLDELAVDRQGLRKFIAPMARRVTIAELLDDYAADIRLREAKSLDKMLAHMKPVRTYFGPMRATDVTADVVDRYIVGRVAAKKSNSTVNRGTAILATAFKLAQRRGKVTTVPVIRKLPETNVRRVFYDKGEFERAVAAAPEYLRDALRFFYATGWRKQEVVGLKWNMVDLAAGTITLPTSKNTRGRVLALAGDLAPLMKQREADRLVETPNGGVKIAEYVFHRQGRATGRFQASLGHGEDQGGPRVGGQGRQRQGRDEEGRHAALRVREDHPRLPTDRRPQPLSRRRSARRGQGDHRPRNRRDVLPLQHHGRGRPPRGDGEGFNLRRHAPN